MVNYLSGLLPKVGKTTTFIFLPDWHYPHHLFLDAYLDMFSDNPPDYFFYGGDAVNNDPFNHWAKSKPRQVKEMPNPREYFELANEELFAPVREALGRKTKIGYLLGNHEGWSSKAIDMIPELQGWAEIENNIDKGLVDFFVPEKHLATLGDLSFTHGHNIPYSKREHAKKMATLYHRSVVFGHYHDYETASLTVPAGEKTIVGISVPCSTDINPLSYGKDMPANRSNGFAWGNIYPDGRFDVFVSMIHDGVFSFRERTYKSKMLVPKKLDYQM